MDIGSKKGGCWESRHAWVGAPSHYEVCTPVISSALPFFSLFPTLNLSMRQHPQGMKSPPPPRQAYATSLYQTFIFCVLVSILDLFERKKIFLTLSFSSGFRFLSVCLNCDALLHILTHQLLVSQLVTFPKSADNLESGRIPPSPHFALQCRVWNLKREQKIQRRKGLNKVK